MSEETLIYFLLSLIQLIGTAISGWVLITVIRLLGRVIQMETKLDSFPIQQISNNRHRIENLERATDSIGQRVTAIETRCERKHRNDP